MVARQAAGLDGVEVLQADAGITDACAGAVPAQIVAVCGIFGNITVSDIQAMVAALPSLCAPGALVLWTRHRRPPDPAIRSWFGQAGFREEAFDCKVTVAKRVNLFFVALFSDRCVAGGRV